MSILAPLLVECQLKKKKTFRKRNMSSIFDEGGFFSGVVENF